MKCSHDTPCSAARCLKFGVLALAGIVVVAWIVMLLWNALLPALIAGISPIGYWQALGVLVLSRILFGGLRGGCHGHWRAPQARWESLTPEERERLKGRFQGRWGRCGSAPGQETAADDKPSAGA